MKIMTLNAHSHGVDLPGHIFQKNLDGLAECIVRQQVDIIALQEVCQTRTKEPVDEKELRGYVRAGSGTAIRRDNYVLQLVHRLEQRGFRYGWTWDGIKIGYGIFDEGLAVVSRYPVGHVEEFHLSNSRDYGNWKTRKALAANIRIGGQKAAWFVSTHMGWWKDEEEPFVQQMDRLEEKLAVKEGRIFLMGDFNSPANERNTGYDYVKSCGWLDTWQMSGNTGSRITVPDKIDGWGDEAAQGLCIDYIWTNMPVDVRHARIVFSGQEEPVISDHFGILAEIE